MPACEEQPVIGNNTPAPGGPFTYCGFSDQLQIPYPTNIAHGLHDIDGHSICIQPFEWVSWWGVWFPELPTVNVHNTNSAHHNAAYFPGDLVFTGHHVTWKNVHGGVIDGEYVCAPSATQIEVDGECLCPVPEPGFASTLAIAVVAIVAMVVAVWGTKP